MRTTILQFRKGLFIILLSLVTVTNCLKAQPVIPKLKFTTYKNESGTPGNKGAIYRFTNIETGIDALVEIADIQNAVLDKFDQTNTGFNEAFQPVITVPANKTGYIEWNISFVNSGTAKPYKFPVFSLTFIDVDGAPNVNEFILTKAPGNHTTYSSTELQVSKVSGDIKAVSSNKTYSGVDTIATSAMIGFDFSNTHKVSFQTGIINNSGSSQQRLTSVYFQKFASLGSLPVKLITFSGNWQNDKVVLNWTGYQAINFSYFEVERSTDAHNFKSAGVVFPSYNVFTEEAFKFSDKVAPATYYYRLKMVDLDGHTEYSFVVKISANDKKSAELIKIYPNPAVESITVNDVQALKGQVKVSDMSGRNWNLIRKSNNTFDVRSLPVGVYFLNIGDNTAKFMKQ